MFHIVLAASDNQPWYIGAASAFLGVLGWTANTLLKSTRINQKMLSTMESHGEKLEAHGKAIDRIEDKLWFGVQSAPPIRENR